MNLKFLWMFAAAFILFSCGGEEESSDDTTDATNETDSTATEENVSGAIDPFPDFPKGKLNASAGDVVLSPSKTWQEDATAEGADQVTMIFYNQTLAEAGDQYSKVDFMGDKGVEIPNYMIVPIKPNQTAKKGDILLTWWQSGSGMQRAIVTDDSDPNAPVVNYLDLDWDNPATTNDGVGIGQATYQIEPGTFHVLSGTWQPGTTVAVDNDGKTIAAQVINVQGDKVLTLGFAGKMAVYPKSSCTPVPVKPSVSVGDDIQAPWVGSFVNTKVTKVDAQNGRIWCEDPYSDDPMVIPFGDVMKGLEVQ